MSAQLKEKPQFVDLPPRDKTVVKARPTTGDHQEQLDNAFAITFDRYEKAIEELAQR